MFDCIFERLTTTLCKKVWLNNIQRMMKSELPSLLNGRCDYLDEREQHRLYSAARLSSFAKVIQELLLNSIDAHAKSIDIGICFENMTVIVSDDGKGHPNFFCNLS